MTRTIVNPIIKDIVAFVKTADETNGKVSELEITLMPGGGHELHYHKTYSETFTAVEGELGLKTGKKTSKFLKPGETHTIEPMGLHCFFNPTNKEIKFKIEIKPGHGGFENSLRILYGMASDGLTNKKSIPKNLKHIALIACMSEMNGPGFWTLIFPVLKRIALKAKAAGEEQMLIYKYCM
jgi:mannose-6-phosphate isomerase-like protein (cupin superfamily)